MLEKQLETKLKEIRPLHLDDQLKTKEDVIKLTKIAK